MTARAHSFRLDSLAVLRETKAYPREGELVGTKLRMALYVQQADVLWQSGIQMQSHGEANPWREEVRVQEL